MPASACRRDSGGARARAAAPRTGASAVFGFGHKVLHVQLTVRARLVLSALRARRRSTSSEMPARPPISAAPAAPGPSPGVGVLALGHRCEGLRHKAGSCTLKATEATPLDPQNRSHYTIACIQGGSGFGPRSSCDFYAVFGRTSGRSAARSGSQRGKRGPVRRSRSMARAQASSARTRTGSTR